jgi:hypothetical protein
MQGAGDRTNTTSTSLHQLDTVEPSAQHGYGGLPLRSCSFLFSEGFDDLVYEKLRQLIASGNELNDSARKEDGRW